MNKLTKSLKAYKKCFGKNWGGINISPKAPIQEHVYDGYISEKFIKSKENKWKNTPKNK